MVSVPVEPVGWNCRLIVQSPLVVEVAVVKMTLVGQLSSPALANSGAVIGPVTDPAGLVLAGSSGTAPLVLEVSQVTLTAPMVKPAVLPAASDAVNACPAGPAVVDDCASWAAAGTAGISAAPRPTTKATTRVRGPRRLGGLSLTRISFLLAVGGLRQWRELLKIWKSYIFQVGTAYYR